MSAEPVYATHPLLAHHGPWTEQDYLALPEIEGMRVELVDGELHLSPSPSVDHQEVLLALCIELRRRRRGDLKVVPGVDVRLGVGRILIPDVVLRRKSGAGMTRASNVELAVEIVSPLGKARDRILKPALYAEAGIGWYLRVEQEPRLELVLYRREDSLYVAHSRAVEGQWMEISELEVSIEVDALLRDE